MLLKYVPDSIAIFPNQLCHKVDRNIHDMMWKCTIHGILHHRSLYTAQIFLSKISWQSAVLSVTISAFYRFCSLPKPHTLPRTPSPPHPSHKSVADPWGERGWGALRKEAIASPLTSPPICHFHISYWCIPIAQAPYVIVSPSWIRLYIEYVTCLLHHNIIIGLYPL